MTNVFKVVTLVCLFTFITLVLPKALILIGLTGTEFWVSNVAGGWLFGYGFGSVLAR